jgi:2'-5' RNA ligase
MAEQFLLPGIDAAPLQRRGTDSLFFAIRPDPSINVRIASLAQRLLGEHGLTGKPLTTDRFHVSLHHIGKYVGLSQGLIAAASAAAASVVMPEVEIIFDRVTSFRQPGKKPLVLLGNDNAVLNRFWQSLGIAMRRVGVGPRRPASRYMPHLTLLYDSRSVREQAIEPIVWTAREFVLIHSLLGRSQHVLLARWPARG